MGPHYELAAVGRRWGERIALRDVTLTIRPGELVALVGPSGGGKSTLIRVLGGVLRPTSGAIRVDQQDLATMSPGRLRKYRSRCGVVGQGLSLVPQLTVHQNVVAGYLPFWPWYRVMAASMWPTQRSRVGEVLGNLGIRDRQWDITSVLSGGQQQRVAIARALIHGPDVVLADEPTSSLDPRTAEETSELILKNARASRSTLVFCTHWLDLVQPHVDRVIGLREGTIAFDRFSRDVTERDLADLYAGSHERI